MEFLRLHLKSGDLFNGKSFGLGRDDDEIQHKVTLTQEDPNDFQLQYMGYNPSWFKMDITYFVALYIELHNQLLYQRLQEYNL